MSSLAPDGGSAAGASQADAASVAAESRGRLALVCDGDTLEGRLFCRVVSESMTGHAFLSHPDPIHPTDEVD